MTGTLESALARQLNADVADLRRLPGGASRETWSFTAGGEPLIVRLDAPGRVDAAAMAREAGLLVSAADAGVPVPRLVAHGDDLDGTPFLIMKRLAGETIPRKLLRDGQFVGVRPRLARELGAILARLHTMAPVPGLPDGDPLAGLAAQYESQHEPRPAIEVALRWLADNRPAASGRRTVVHGDFRTGNLMITPSGVSGVLDWELTHLGDPAEDLGWLCAKAWRFGSPFPAGGFGSREDLLTGYAAAGGTPPTPGELHWWEVYGTLRWAVLCRMQAERYLSGNEPNIEYAVLGRKVCEQEHDLFLALGLTHPVTVADPLDAGPDAGSPPHDLPGAGALLDAVGDFLRSAPQPDERLRFHALVAAGALRIARRELLLGAAHAAAHQARLNALGCTSDAGLAAAVRAGTLDDRRDDVIAAIRASLVDKLTVANPRHLSIPAS